MNNFKVSEVTCNGTGGQGYQAVLKHKDAIVEICQEVRDLIGLDELFSLATKDKNSDYHRGIDLKKLRIMHIDLLVALQDIVLLS